MTKLGDQTEKLLSVIPKKWVKTSEIADLAGVRKTSIYGVLKQLHHEGLIEKDDNQFPALWRRTCADSRIKQLKAEMKIEKPTKEFLLLTKKWNKHLFVNT